MNLERAKSIILAILIVTSSYLTWSIWTYEPKYEKIGQGNYINIETDEKTVGDVIKPNYIFIHRDQRHFQTSNQADLVGAEKQIGEWHLSNLKRLSSQMKKKEFNEFIHANGTIEISFPDEIPLTLYKTALRIKDKEIPDFSFDQILYKQSDTQTQKGVIYFSSSEKRSLMKASIDSSELKAFNDHFYQKAYSFPEYVVYAVQQNQFFVPKNQIRLKRYKYYIDYLDIDNFKDALFMDPLNVRHESVVGGEEYTDSTRLMSVDKANYMISYINPSQKSKTLSSSSDLLAKSIEYVNNHAGWKESNYRLANIDEANQSVTFRLYKNGYPVFNTFGMTEIREIWGEQEIYSYQRPYFTLDFVLPSEDDVVLMPSGLDVMNQLKRMRNFDDLNVQDLTMGYTLSIAPLDTNLISLEPTWYYRSDGNWFQVPFNPGGEINGLE